MLSTPGEAGELESPAIDRTRTGTADIAAPDAERARLEEAAAGRYRVDALIGRGLFSTVFRATQLRGAAEVAIKLLDAGVRITPEILEDLEAGQRACAALADEGVVAASSVEQHESATFMVMSLMHGGSLTELLRSRGPMPLRSVATIVSEVAATLDRIHAAGIIHRGLTPGSILFDFSGRACVADIGVTDKLLAAGSLDPSLTAPARAYAAPEQWRTRNVDGRADQYALALIAHEMLTGEPPRHRETVEGFRVLDPLGILPDVPLRRGIPLSVNATLRKALSAAIMSRFPTATAFAEALAAPVANAPRVGPVPRFEIHVQHKGRLAAAVGVLVAAIAIAGGVRSGLASSAVASGRAAFESLASAPRKIELPRARPTLAVTPTRPEPSPALSLPPAFALPPARAADRSNRPSPSDVRSVAVSTGSVVTAPRSAATKDTASLAASKMNVPNALPAVTPIAPAPPERKSWFARLFSSDDPPPGLPLSAYIRVAVDRGEATVMVDGVERGTAPVTVHVNAGHHTVAVDGPVHYANSSTGVVVGSLDTARVTFRAARKN